MESLPQVVLGIRHCCLHRQNWCANCCMGDGCHRRGKGHAEVTPICRKHKKLDCRRCQDDSSASG